MLDEIRDINNNLQFDDELSEIIEDENNAEVLEESEKLEKELESENAFNSKQSNKIYVTKATLLEELRISRELDQLTLKAIDMFLLMINKISSVKKYPSEEEKQDCKATAMMKICLYWKSFNPEKYTNPNPFAYFTSVIANGLAEGWNTLHPEKKKAPGAIFTSLDNNIYSI